MQYDCKNMSEVPFDTVCEIISEPSLYFMDLGFCKGAKVRPFAVCLCGGTRLYEVKQTYIALRNQDAAKIAVKVVV